MTQRRAEEVKALVREVLSDAETRASLLQEGLTAGHDGEFFLQSNDGAFRLNLAGQLQVRYIWNNRDGAHEADPNDDNNLAGFQLRRTKLKGEGHIGEPRIRFGFSLAGDRDDETAFFEDYWLAYNFSDQLSISAGRMKMPFALQNLTSSSRQLAVERSSVNEYFNVDRSEGVVLAYKRDNYRLAGSINDGAAGEFTDFDENTTDVAFTGRAEAKLAGEWSQLKDPAIAWEGEGTGLFLGAALDYEIGETGTVAANNNVLRWTGDVTYESNGFGVLAAAYGQHTDMDSGDNFNDYGLLVEAGYFVVPNTLQPFARYELILQDDSRPGVTSGATNEDTSIVTAGFNWYQHKHDAKFTMDVVYALDPLGTLAGNDGGVSTGLGLRPDAAGEEGQFAVRAQYQLKW